MNNTGAIIVDIGQYYTKAGVRVEFVPVKIFKTYHHLIFEPMEELEDYNGFKCGKERILGNLDDQAAYNLVQEYLEFLFLE